MWGVRTCLRPAARQPTYLIPIQTHPFEPAIHQSKRGAAKTIDDSQALNLGPKAAEGEHVFGVAHIFASFNDTFVVRACVVGRLVDWCIACVGWQAVDPSE